LGHSRTSTGSGVGLAVSASDGSAVRGSVSDRVGDSVTRFVGDGVPVVAVESLLRPWQPAVPASSPRNERRHHRRVMRRLIRLRAQKRTDSFGRRRPWIADTVLCNGLTRQPN